jgi:hypothetical protein
VWLAHISLRGEAEEADSPVGLHKHYNTALLVDIAEPLILKNVKFRRLGRELNGINGYNLYVIKY